MTKPMMGEVLTPEMMDIKKLIIETAQEREEIKQLITSCETNAFTLFRKLEQVDGVLSQLDTQYKRLWDYHNTK